MLVMLPCAGGCAANYSKYKKYLNEVIIYEYPGHWTRYDEPVKSSMKALVEALSEEIIFSHDNSKVFLFGHSMGGLVAWYTAKELLLKNVSVAGLFIAACNTPCLGADVIELVKDDADIKAFLKKVRQVPEKVLDSGFFEENLLPVIRNDFHMIQGQMDNQFQDNRPLPISIICFCGSKDPIVSCADMDQWKCFTNNQFELHSCIGDHFFVHDDDNIRFICGTIRKVIST